MDDILLSDSNADTLQRMSEDEKTVLPKWGLQIAPEKNTKRRFCQLRLQNKFSEN